MGRGRRSDIYDMSPYENTSDLYASEENQQSKSEMLHQKYVSRLKQAAEDNARLRRLNILLPEGTVIDDNNDGAFGPHHKVYDIWLDDFERRAPNSVEDVKPNFYTYKKALVAGNSYLSEGSRFGDTVSLGGKWENSIQSQSAETGSQGNSVRQLDYGHQPSQHLEQESTSLPPAYNIGYSASASSSGVQEDAFTVNSIEATQPLSASDDWRRGGPLAHSPYLYTVQYPGPQVSPSEVVLPVDEKPGQKVVYHSDRTVVYRNDNWHPRPNKYRPPSPPPPPPLRQHRRPLRGRPFTGGDHYQRRDWRQGPDRNFGGGHWDPVWRPPGRRPYFLAREEGDDFGRGFLPERRTDLSFSDAPTPDGGLMARNLVLQLPAVSERVVTALLGFLPLGAIAFAYLGLSSSKKRRKRGISVHSKDDIEAIEERVMTSIHNYNHKYQN